MGVLDGTEVARIHVPPDPAEPDPAARDRRKTTFCEIGAQGLAPETAVESGKAMGDVLGQPWNAFTDLFGDNTNSDKGLHRMRVRRKLDDVQRTALLAEEQAEAACFDRAFEPQKREQVARETEAAAKAWSDLSAGTSGGGSSGDGWHEEVTLYRRNSSR